MSNPLLSPAENAELAVIRRSGAASLSHQDSDNAPAQLLATDESINWAAMHALIPWLAVCGAWLIWALFLLIPTLFGLHYTGLFPAASNWGYVLMGVTLCLAATVAAKVQHGVRAIAFTFSVLLLSYWF